MHTWADRTTSFPVNTRFAKAAEADTDQYEPPSCTRPMTHGREARPKCEDQELGKGSPKNLLRIAVTSSAPLFIWLSLMPCLTTAGTGTPGLRQWGEILKSHQRIDCLELCSSFGGRVPYRPVKDATLFQRNAALTATSSVLASTESRL